MPGSVSGIRAGRAYVELGTRDLLTSQLAAAQTKITAFADAAKAALAGAFVAGVPTAAAVKTFADFDDQMRLVAAVAAKGSTSFEQLTATAKELGRTTSWTASQVAEGMVSLGRAGFNTDEIDTSISSVMDLARATGSEIGAATDIAGNALRAFGLPATEFERVCDVLTATANGSAQTLDDLGEAFKYVAPIAAATGHSIEDTAKIVGSLANFGVKGSQAGTVIKAIQTRMASDESAQAKYAELGIDTTDAEGNLRKVNDVLLDLGRALADMPNAEKLATIKTLFGQYGLTGVSLTASNFEQLNEAIDNANGTAAATAQSMDEGLGGAIRITQSAIEGAAIALGNSLTPALTDLAAKIQTVAEKSTAWLSTHQQEVVEIATLAAKYVALSGAVYVVSKAISGVCAVAKTAATVYSGLSKTVEYLCGVQRAQAAVETARQARGAAMLKLEQAVAAVNAAKTAPTLAAAQAELTLATAEARSATAAEADAVAKAHATAATAALMAGTIAAVAVVAALGYAYLSWAGAADKAAQSARNASDAQDQFLQNREGQRQADQELFNELKTLSEQQSMTSDQFARARFIVAELSDRYGDLGIQCDETARKINGMAAAQELFNQKQKAQAIQDQKDQIATYQEEIDRNKAAIKRQDSFVGGVGAAIRSGFSQGKMLERRQELFDRNLELERKIKSLQNKIKMENEQSAAAVVQQSQPLQQLAPQPVAEQPVVEAQPAPTPTTPNATPSVAPVGSPTTPNATPSVAPAGSSATPNTTPSVASETFNDATSQFQQSAEEFANAIASSASEVAAQCSSAVSEAQEAAQDVHEAANQAGDQLDLQQSQLSRGTFSAVEASDNSRSEMRAQTDVLKEIESGLKKYFDEQTNEEYV